jgi:hypothetical protein
VVRGGHLGVADRIANLDSSAGVLSVLRGNGDGTLQPARQLSVPAKLHFGAVTDVSGDGFANLILSSYLGSPAPFSYSVQLNDGHW